MCGLVGFFKPHGASFLSGEASLRKMQQALIHRGPDDGGVWTDHESGIFIAHRRLAVVDLSPTGAQPMLSASGRYVLAFNGEIYNHRALRAALSEPEGGWRGGSDTETLLAAIEQSGFESAIQLCVGMFAMALWDRHHRTLTLSRDRLGEKPLYVGWDGDGQTLLFGSEIASLERFPGFAASVDPDAVASLLRWGYIADGLTIRRGIRKLSPGTWLRVAHDGRSASGAYWSTINAIRAGRANPINANNSHAIEQLDERLRASVRDQMIADVPLGAMLSGGIDSSLVVSLMQAQSTAPVRTYSIGFEERRFDEAPYARAVAAHLGTTHSELTVTSADALNLIPTLSAVYDEPLGDSSQIPTILLSRMIRNEVTVALSGDGGDEIFGGYRSHAIIATLDRHELLGSSGLSAVARPGARIIAELGNLLGGTAFGPRLNRLSRLVRLVGADRTTAGAQLALRWDAPPMRDAPLLTFPLAIGPDASAAEELMALDTRRYLPDNVLVKVDRAAMSCSLETRAPLLDHRVLELAWRLPMSLKLDGQRSKIALRAVLERYVPSVLIDRPKAGFSVPLAQWLRGPLRDWAGDLIEGIGRGPDSLLDAAPIRRAFDQHCRATADHQARLWSVLSYEAWRRDRGKQT